MRLSVWLVGSLGLLTPESESRNIISAFIRPHARFLLQSVVEKPTRKLVEFEDAAQKDGQYCQASSSLVAYESRKALPLFKLLHTAVAKSIASTSSSLSLISDYTKEDDVRRAQHMGNLWKRSIILELEDIGKGIGERAKRFDEDTVKNVQALKEKAEMIESTKRGDDVSEIFPKAAANKQFALSARQHNITEKAKSVVNDVEGKDQVTPMSYSPAEYQAMVDDYKKAHEGLSLLQTSVENLAKRAKSLMDEHEKKVKVGETYQLKWIDAVREGDDTRTISQALLDFREVHYTPQSSNTEKDSFKKTDAEDLGKKIYELIARVSAYSGSPSQSSVSDVPDGDRKGKFADFEEFITATSSEVERLDRLSSTLNILVLRKLGLNDASRSLDDLLKVIKAEVVSLNGELTKPGEANDAGLFVRISKELQGLEAKAKTVYTEASALPNVQINPKLVEGDSIDNLDRHMATLANFVGVDAHGEFLPHVNLIVNVLWRAHGHMLAFVEEYRKEVPLISSVIDKVNLQNESGPDMNALSEKNGKFREAADCVLYGRVDSILRRVKIQNYRSETELCGKLHEQALAAMTKIVDIDTLKKEQAGA